MNYIACYYTRQHFSSEEVAKSMIKCTAQTALRCLSYMTQILNDNKINYQYTQPCFERIDIVFHVLIQAQHNMNSISKQSILNSLLMNFRMVIVLTSYAIQSINYNSIDTRR